MNDLTEQLELSQYNTSKHLRVLKQAGIVEVRALGQRREYSIATDTCAGGCSGKGRCSTSAAARSGSISCRNEPHASRLHSAHRARGWMDAGRALFDGPGPPSLAEAELLREKESTTHSAQGPDSPKATDAKAQRIVEAALRKGDRFERENETYLAVEALTAADFQRLISNAGALKEMAKKLDGNDSRTNRDLLSGLMARWMKVDPAAAMAWAPRALESLPKNHTIRAWVLDEFGARSPVEMLALARTRPDAAEREGIISRALRELTLRDPAQARAWLADCTDAADRRVAEKAFRRGTVQADPLRAIDLAGSIENRQEANDLLRFAAENAAKMGPGTLRQLATMPMPSWMISSVIGQLSATDPALAVDLAIKTGAEATNDRVTLESAFSALAQRDPAQALAKLEGLKSDALASAIWGLGPAWASREPAEALVWLAGRPAAERIVRDRISHFSSDTLLVSFGSWLDEDPAAARTWADTLPAGENRDAVQTQLARLMAAQGKPEEAAQVLAGLGRAADSEALKFVGEAWAARDPAGAAAWAVGQEAGPVQNRAIETVVGIWGDSDPRAVGDWLGQFPPGETRDRALVAFLMRTSNWISTKAQQNAEFARWFDQIDDPRQRAIAARTIFWRELRNDPAGARAWYSNLPNVDPDVIRETLRANSD